MAKMAQTSKLTSVLNLQICQSMSLCLPCVLILKYIIEYFIVHIFIYRNGYTLNGHDVLPDIQELPPSRPMTPNEQMDIMRAIEDEVLQATGIPSERDEQVRIQLLNLHILKLILVEFSKIFVVTYQYYHINVNLLVKSVFGHLFEFCMCFFFCRDIITTLRKESNVPCLPHNTRMS